MSEKQPSGHLARNVLDVLRHKLPAHNDLAKVIQDTLGLTASAAYKRLRGETAFTADELAELARHFGISLDAAVLRGRGMAPMSFPAAAQPIDSPISFLRRVEASLQTALKLPEVRLWYASTEIPFFQYMRYPELTAFKLYMWNKTTWELPAYNQPVFSPELFLQDPQMEPSRRSLLQLYAQIPSQEFWPLQILDNTLSQVRYATYEGNLPNRALAQLLLSQIAQLVDDLEHMAQLGYKDIEGCRVPMPAPFELYENEIMHTSNIFFVLSVAGRQVFYTYDNPNFLTTDHPDFCDYTEDWFAKIRRRSQRISVDGAKHRKVFFEALRQRVSQIRL